MPSAKMVPPSFKKFTHQLGDQPLAMAVSPDVFGVSQSERFVQSAISEGTLGLADAKNQHA